MKTIADLYTRFNYIYSDVNENRSFEYMYGYLTRKTSYLSRAFLRNPDNVNHLKDAAIEAISWIFAISKKLDVSPEEAFFQKFPNCCPYCISKPCVCIQTHREPELIDSASRIKDELISNYRYKVLNAAPPLNPVKMINDIYPANRSIWNTFGGFYHSSCLFEELGELHEAYNKKLKDSNYPQINLNEEMADILAWMFSFWGIALKDIDLFDSFMDYYIHNCPVCYKAPCECSDYSSRFITTEEKKSKLDELRALINDIKADPELKNYQTEFEAIESSIERVMIDESDSDTRRLASEVKDKIGNISNQIEKTSKVAANLNVILKLGESLLALFK